MRALLSAVFLLVVAFGNTCGADPPFWGTVFIGPEVMTEDDPTVFTTAKYAGTGKRTMYDRRSGWVDLEPHLINAHFSDGSIIEVQVNPEINKAEAEGYANRYLPAIGQLPLVLRRDVKTVWIHRGHEPLGGGNNNLLLHIDSVEDNMSKGVQEETLIHEASHTSLDADHAKNPRWLQAQALDGEFITSYAKDHPKREDVAESFQRYLVLRWKPDRLTSEQRQKITSTIPNRIRYFDSLDLNIQPLSDDTNWRVFPWTSSDGKTIYAKFLSSNENEVVIDFNGKTFNVRFDRLSPESRDLAKKLSGHRSRENAN